MIQSYASEKNVYLHNITRDIIGELEIRYTCAMTKMEIRCKNLADVLSYNSDRCMMSYPAIDVAEADKRTRLSHKVTEITVTDGVRSYVSTLEYPPVFTETGVTFNRHNEWYFGW